MVTPEVSVIIPAYNSNAYIAQAIESVLKQTEDNIEVIVVNDGSTDNTEEVVRGIVDKRLKVFVNPENLGLSATRNYGLREARGKWIALLDADDWYVPDRLEKMLQIASVENADIISDDLYLIRDGETSSWSTLLLESGEQIDKMKKIDPVYFVKTDIYGQRGLHLGITKPLFKREFLIQHDIKYDESATTTQDFWLIMNCLIQGARFIFIPKPYYFYRSHPGSMVTKSKLKFLNESYYAAKNFMQQEEIMEEHPELKRILYKFLAAFDKNRSYYNVIEPLKERKILAASIAMIRYPYFFVHLITQLPAILNRRLQYHLLGNKLAYEMLYQRTKPRNS